jgi:ATP-dependent DNA ligase
MDRSFLGGASPNWNASASEGIVAKDKESSYISGTETWRWQKIKNREFQRKEPVEFQAP